MDPGQPVRRERIPHELAHGISAEGIGLRSAAPSPAGGVMSLERAVSRSLASLLPREVKLINMRFGIGDRTNHTLEEVGEDVELTQERIRQIEEKALRKLRPSRSRGLEPFVENDESLAGRVVLRAGRTLVVEIELLDTLMWEPGVTASLLLADGRLLEAVVDLVRTTRKGRHIRGQTLRLTLEATVVLAANEPREILIESAKKQLRIQLEP